MVGCDTASRWTREGGLRMVSVEPWTSGGSAREDGDATMRAGSRSTVGS